MTPRLWLLAVLFQSAGVVFAQQQTTNNGHPRERAPQPDELLYKSPGHYVMPGEGPEYFSPHYRVIPDYNTAPSNGDGSRLRYKSFGPGCDSATSTCSSFGWGNSPYYGGDTAAAYNQGRYDADRDYLAYLAAQRAGRLLNQFKDMFDEGMRLFHDGAYDRAAVKMMGAAQSNESNAACRLHAAHSLFALGQYRRSAEYLARAFELSPSLPFKTYDIRDEYGTPGDFVRQYEFLRNYVRKHPRDASAMTVLGYVTYYTSGPAASYPALRRAAALNPGSYLIPKLLDVAAQTVPQDESLMPASNDRSASSRPAPVKNQITPKAAQPTSRRWVKV